MISIKKLYKDVYDSVNGICDRTFLRSRPKSVGERIDSYLVVAFPYAIRNNEMDSAGSYNLYTTTVQMSVYVRDKMSASNPSAFNVNMMDAKIQEIYSKMPIVTDDIVLSSPRITMTDEDGEGFGVTLIQCSLRTK